MSNVWNFIKNNKAIWLVVAAIALFGGGLVVGRYTLAANVVVTEKVHEVEKQVVVEKIVTQIEKVYIHDSQQAQKIHRTVVEGIDPPGCKSKTTTEDINIDTVVHDNTHDTQVQYVDRVVEKWQEKIVEKVTTKLAQPDWSIYAGVGVDIPFFLGQPQHGVPGMLGTVVQAGVDRRLVGPLWFGVFGNTEGVAGANLRVTW